MLIALLILNTFFWFHLIVIGTPRTYFQRTFLPGGKASGKIVERSYIEKLSIVLGEWGSSKVSITFLLITDAVLIAISFMIILLNKKDRNFKEY